MKRLLAPLAVVVVMLSLSACGDGTPANPAPAPVPAPSPSPAPPFVALPPRRGRKVFEADWTGPGINCHLDINGDVPPIDNTPANATWGTFLAPNTRPLTQPGPNELYSAANGFLKLSSKDGGFPIITKQTFPRRGCTSFQGRFTLDAIHDPEGWGGLVAYNGDALAWPPGPTPTLEEQFRRMWDTGEWWGIYFSQYLNNLVVDVWSASVEEEQRSVKINLGRPYTFRIDMDWEAGRVDLLVADERDLVILHLTSSLAAPLNRDPVLFQNDPRLAVFLGNLDITVGPLDVFGAEVASS